MSTAAVPGGVEISARTRRPSGTHLLLASVVLLVLVCLLSLAIGPTGITLTALPRVIYGFVSTTSDAALVREKIALLDIRLPRTLIAVFVGASLAVAGAMMQGLFRNPLADPGLIGVSAGAALAALATIALGNGIAAPLLEPLGIYAIPIAAFAGGTVSTAILVAVASRHRQLMVGTLLLAGIALGAFAAALTGLIAFASDDRALRDLTLWTMGSLAGASWQKVLAILPFVVAVSLIVPRVIRGLNGFLLGEAEAFHLGVNVEKTKRTVIVATAAATGAAVAVSGIIGFVGIVVPHMVRIVAGPDHRIVLPGSALLGAMLVVMADIIARMIVRPAELPIGIVMAVIGAPVFLHLIIKRGIGGME